MNWASTLILILGAGLILSVLYATFFYSHSDEKYVPSSKPFHGLPPTYYN